MPQIDVFIHVPVMLNEVLEHLNLRPGKVIVDATVGTGGHSWHIAKRILPGGRLICIDQDEESLGIARERLFEFGDSCEFIHANFSDLNRVLKELGLEKVNGMLFDLGVSSFQLDNPQRGFSFQREGPLDMRLDKNIRVCAYDLINNLSEEEISNLLWNFGQERWHNRIAHVLVRERERHPITTTLELATIVAKALPYRYRFHRIHPATRTFQAMRIAVNRELEVLERGIKSGIEFLDKSARICVIAFHSLEDRIIKFAFRQAAAECKVSIVTPKPLTPVQPEIKSNPSSRSAKFRAAERI